MKRILSLLLTIPFVLCALVGCKEKYPPVESTEAEAAVVARLSIGENEYELTYELYRALFLTYKGEIDGGDGSVWSGDDKEKYIAEATEVIFERAAEIFAVFELAKRIGIDPYSKGVEKEIEEMIEVSVEGGSYNDEKYSGFGGDYDAYLESLKASYHNYSTSVLIMRQELIRAELDRHYIGSISADEILSGSTGNGAIKYDRETIRSFYDSDRCARVLLTFVQDTTGQGASATAESIRLEALELALNGESYVQSSFIDRGSPEATAELVRGGSLIAKNSLSYDYTKLADVALELRDLEVSEVVETYSFSEGKRYHIMYRCEKTDEFFEERYTDIVISYLYSAVGGMLDVIADGLEESATLTEAGRAIVHAEIKM